MSEPFARRRRATVLPLLLVLVLGLVGPLHVRGKSAKQKQVDPGSDLQPLRMNSAMAGFLTKKVKVRLDRQSRVQNLLDAIFGSKGLDISYGNQRTKTAIETFESRSGNCMSFTMLFVVMARHLGLGAYFQEVDEVVSWDRRGEIVFTQQHMFAEVEFDNGVVEVDFLPGSEKRYRKVRRISDDRALAHFYNNIGVETLANGAADDAVAWLEKSLELADDFGPAWSNLGVAQRRLGEDDAAEQSYLKALEVGPNDVALNNLSSLYLDQGRQEEAQPLLERSKDYLQRNPYHHFRLASQARRQGQSDDAVRHLRQALRRHQQEAVFHATLAEVLVELGQLEKAIASYEDALRLADEEDAIDVWKQQLEALQNEPADAD